MVHSIREKGRERKETEARENLRDLNFNESCCGARGGGGRGGSRKTADFLPSLPPFFPPFSWGPYGGKHGSFVRSLALSSVGGGIPPFPFLPG